MFYSIYENPLLQSHGYDYVFWNEHDTIPVRTGWLDALYEETFFMHREGIWQKGSAPQYAHGVDVLSSRPDAAEQLFHINGNAIYDFHSPGFRQYLQGAAGAVPNSFDLSLFKHRHQMNAPGYQFVTQSTLSRFQYSSIVLNNPTDLCMPSFGSFLRDKPNTYLVHGKAVRNLRAGTSCCNLFPEDRAVVQRTHSDQYHCLLDDHGSDLADTWIEHGPFDISLKDIDDIAMGLTPRTPYYNPSSICFKDKQCCFPEICTFKDNKGKCHRSFYK